MAPPRGDDAEPGLYLVELRILEHSIPERFKRGRLFGASFLLHHSRDVFFVNVADFLDALTEREECCDDRAGACAEDQIEFFMERAFDHALDLTECAERVEALGSSAVQTQNPTGLLR